jgi:hypothetical protein
VQTLEASLGGQYDRLYLGNTADPETGEQYQIMWAKNRDNALVSDSIYNMLSFGGWPAVIQDACMLLTSATCCCPVGRGAGSRVMATECLRQCCIFTQVPAVHSRHRLGITIHPKRCLVATSAPL